MFFFYIYNIYIYFFLNRNLVKGDVFIGIYFVDSYVLQDFIVDG